MRRTDYALSIEIDEHKIPVTVNHDGEFWAEWEGDSFNSTTFKGLRAALVKVVKAKEVKRCEVVVSMSDYGHNFEDVTLIGLHAGNGNVLYRKKDGEVCQTRGGNFVRALTNEERAEIERLKEAEKAAVRATTDYVAARTVNAEDLVRKALGLPKREEKKR